MSKWRTSIYKIRTITIQGTLFSLCRTNAHTSKLMQRLRLCCRLDSRQLNIAAGFLLAHRLRGESPRPLCAVVPRPIRRFEMRWRLEYSGFLFLLLVVYLAAPSTPEAVATAGSRATSKVSTPAVKEFRSVPGASGALANTYTSSVTLEIEEVTPDPEPLEDPLPLPRPAVITNTVNYPYPCNTLLAEDNGYGADLTAQLYLLDPNGSEVFPRPQSHWVSNKPRI